ncbi:hypothetical protein [Saccharopolyspora cebuensis]|uniref:Uncharacterized protein n=1 Tax=Saccharopolyspora cebuensis TaxID=418759 RepID=A0ABV4CH98_9PSEU
MADDDRPQRDDEQPNGVPEESEAGADEARRGRIRYQDAETTTPREPTLAEKRARIAAEKRQEEQRQAEVQAAADKTRKRRRVMIGGGATVGVVALVAAMYSASEYRNEATAVTEFCASNDPNNPVAQDPEKCTPEYAESQGGYVSGGMFFMPMILPGGTLGPPTPQYRYGYTQPGAPAPTPGQTVQGSSFTKPTDSQIKNTRGQTIQRGGFGITNKGGSGS